MPLTRADADNIYVHDCHAGIGLEACETGGGQCNINHDGYTTQTVWCIIIGVLWFYKYRDTITSLARVPFEHWMVVVPRDKEGERDRGDQNQL